MDINLNDSVARRRNCCSPWHAFVSPSMMTLDSQMAWCGTHKIPSHRGTLGWTGDLTTLLGRFHCVSQDHLNARSIDFRPKLLGIDAQVSEGAVLQDYCKIATILDRIRMHGTGTAKLEHCSPEHSMSKVDNFEKYRGLATATWYYHHVVKKKKTHCRIWSFTGKLLVKSITRLIFHTDMYRIIFETMEYYWQLSLSTIPYGSKYLLRKCLGYNLL